MHHGDLIPVLLAVEGWRSVDVFARWSTSLIAAGHDWES